MQISLPYSLETPLFAVFSEDMVNDGYEDVVNVDISSVVIQAMQTKYSTLQQRLKCILMPIII